MLLYKLEQLSQETVVDEFQDIPPKLIEKLALQVDREVEVIDDPEDRAHF